MQKFNDFKQLPSQDGVTEADFTKAHLLSANGSGRWQLWASAVDEWKSSPVEGRGAGSYRVLVGRSTAPSTKFVRTPTRSTWRPSASSA